MDFLFLPKETKPEFPELFNNDKDGSYIARNELEDFLGFNEYVLNQYCRSLTDYYQTKQYAHCNSILDNVQKIFINNIEEFQNNIIDISLFLDIFENNNIFRILFDALSSEIPEMKRYILNFISILTYIHNDFRVFIACNTEFGNYFYEQLLKLNIDDFPNSFVSFVNILSECLKNNCDFNIQFFFLLFEKMDEFEINPEIKLTIIYYLVSNNFPLKDFLDILYDLISIETSKLIVKICLIGMNEFNINEIILFLDKLPKNVQFYQLISQMLEFSAFEEKGLIINHIDFQQLEQLSKTSDLSLLNYLSIYKILISHWQKHKMINVRDVLNRSIDSIKTSCIECKLCAIKLVIEVIRSNDNVESLITDEEFIESILDLFLTENNDLIREILSLIIAIVDKKINSISSMDFISHLKNEIEKDLINFSVSEDENLAFLSGKILNYFDLIERNE